MTYFSNEFEGLVLAGLFLEQHCQRFKVHFVQIFVQCTTTAVWAYKGCSVSGSHTALCKIPISASSSRSKLMFTSVLVLFDQMVLPSLALSWLGLKEKLFMFWWSESLEAMRQQAKRKWIHDILFSNLQRLAWLSVSNNILHKHTSVHLLTPSQRKGRRE